MELINRLYRKVFLFTIACTLAFPWVALAGISGRVNSQGVSGAPVQVGSGSVSIVLPFLAGRNFALVCNVGTVVAYYEIGPTGGGAPAPSPTSTGTNGIPLFPNTCLTENLNASFTPTGLGLVVQAELDAVCSSGTCPISTFELP